MAKIPLRAYIKEIENLVERGEIEQAVSHAKNILRSYPKHIDTYRLLGKAFLESQRYSEAADILQRVLSVLPDDFISQIGMSIIREDEGNLDAAIWHMERAYEVQPFNPAVQDELRRLYGRRDGVEPPKIRLTRGALVRMYTRGELYPQAIAETRAALAEDPQRLDLMVLLARLYYLSDHKNDAAEVCSELIRKLPYCYEANRLLAEFLPTTSRAEEAQKFQQRIFALDPYAAFVTPAAPASDKVPDQAVMVEQFSLDQAVEEAQIPDWARTVGVEGWEDTEEEVLPDWLNTLKPEPSKTGPLATPAAAPEAKTEEEPLPPTESSAQRAEAPGAAGEEAASLEASGLEAQEGDMIPDWMKEAGWITTDRSADEIMASQEATEGEEIAPADLPDWVQSIAPAETGKAGEDEERTDWLASILAEPGGTNGKEAEGIPPAAAGFAAAAFTASESDKGEEPGQEGLPDWMKDFGTSEQATSSQTTDGELPDWFTQMQEEQAPGESTPVEFEGLPDWTQLSEPTTAEAAPDWLQSLGGTPPEQTDEEPAQPAEINEPVLEVPQASEAAPAESALEETTQVLPEAEAPAPAGETARGAMPDLNSMSMDEALAWLESLAAKQGADEATLFTSPKERAEQPPEWVSREMETIQPSEVLPPAEPVLAKTESAEPQVLPEPEVPAEPQVFEAPVSEEIDWLKQDETAAGEVVETATQALEEPAAVKQPEAEEQPAVEAQPGAPDFNDMDAAMAWLESLAAKQGADEATLVTPPEQRLEKPPEWITNEIESQVPALETEAGSRQELEVETAPEPEAEPAAPLPPMEVPPAETFMVEQTETELPAAEQEIPLAEPETKPPAEEDLDSTFAWLESLAAKQGADEVTLVSEPGERKEIPPEWLKQEPGLEENPTAEAQVPEWLQNIQGEPGAEFLMEQGADQKIEEQIPDWLANIGQEEPARAQADEETQPWAVEQEAEPAESGPQVTGPTGTEWAEAAEPVLMEEVPAQEENQAVPEWLMDLETESAPAREETEGPAMPPEYRSEWQPEADYGQPAEMQPAAAHVQSLEEAQKALSRGRLDRALEGYNNFIKNGVHLEETIHDLRDALYRYPVDINIYQTLGDAFARNNQLQEALDAYTKAEELLR